MEFSSYFLLFQMTARGVDLSPSKFSAAILFTKGMHTFIKGVICCPPPRGSCVRVGHTAHVRGWNSKWRNFAYLCQLGSGVGLLQLRFCST